MEQPRGHSAQGDTHQYPRGHFPSSSRSSPFVHPDWENDNRSTDDPHERMNQMRQQFFDRERERDAFFDANPHHSFFRSRPMFDNFPSHHRFPQSEFERFPKYQQHYYEENPQMSSSPSGWSRHMGSPSPGGFVNPSNQHQQPESIPIRVIHESKGPSKKHHSVSARGNTTELPARGTPPPQSPRLERAASEPPKVFNQRLFHPHNHYSSIPENESSSVKQDHLIPPNEDQGQGHHNLATSKSAPNVPESPRSLPKHQQPQQSVPVPPPRRSSPTKQYRQEPNQDDNDPNKIVRRIPIFVEGRDDPHNYPHNTSNPNKSRTNLDLGLGSNKNDKVKVNVKMNPNQAVNKDKDDLASPVGPPPGPIPMGYIPQENSEKNQAENQLNVPVTRKDPESPKLLDPATIIPLPCSPYLYRKTDDSNNERKEEKPEEKPVTEKPEETKNMVNNVAFDKMKKVQDEVQELQRRIDNFKGQKTDKEYLFLDEMLTRYLLSLDSVDTMGKEELRHMRKESIRSINRCLSMLDSRAKQTTTDTNESNANSNDNDNEKVLSEKSSSSQKEDKEKS